MKRRSGSNPEQPPLLYLKVICTQPLPKQAAALCALDVHKSGYLPYLSVQHGFGVKSATDPLRFFCGSGCAFIFAVRPNRRCYSQSIHPNIQGGKNEKERKTLFCRTSRGNTGSVGTARGGLRRLAGRPYRKHRGAAAKICRRCKRRKPVRGKNRSAFIRHKSRQRGMDAYRHIVKPFQGHV